MKFFKLIAVIAFCSLPFLSVTSLHAASGGYNSTMSKVILETFQQNPLVQQFGFAGKKMQKQNISLIESLSGNIPDNAIKQSLGFKSGTYAVETGGNQPIDDLLTIDGTFDVSNITNNAITITTINGLSDITVNGTVETAVPSSGGKVTINGTEYTSGEIIPGLTVVQSQSANTFAITGNLRVNATADEQYITTASGSSLTVTGDIYFDGNDIGRIVNQGSITATNITMNNNEGSGNTSINNQGSITATNDIIMNNNNTTGTVAIFNPTSGSIIEATNGSITMNNNNANNASIYNDGTITATHGITFESNTVSDTSGNIIENSTGSTMKTDGLVTITTQDYYSSDSNTSFDSSVVTIYKMDGTTALSFSDFAITIDGTPYTTYGSLPTNVVLLAAANQS